MLPGTACFSGAHRRRSLEESDLVELCPAGSDASEGHNRLGSGSLERSREEPTATVKKQQAIEGGSSYSLLLPSIFHLVPPMDRTGSLTGSQPGKGEMELVESKP